MFRFPPHARPIPAPTPTPGSGSSRLSRLSRLTGLLVGLSLHLTLHPPTPAHAQCDGPPQFLPMQGIDRGAQTIALLPNGDVVVNVGAHNSDSIASSSIGRAAGGVPMGAVARYRPATNEFFDLGLSLVGPDNGPGAGWVTEVLALPDGDLIAASTIADMRRRDGTGLGRVARYDSATGVWSSIASSILGSTTPGGGFEPRIISSVILPGGDIIFGGNFFSVNGVNANGIVRYNPTSGVWSPIGSGVTGTSGTNPRVSALALSTNGQLVVGGVFTTAGGVAASNIALINLTTGTGTAVGLGVTGGEVRALGVLPSSGEVLVGGAFSTAGGAAARRIAKFNPTTRVWSAVSGVPTSVVSVISMAELPGGGVLVGGGGGAPLAKITPAGAWTSFASVGHSVVNAIAVLPGGTEAIVTAYGGRSGDNSVWGRTLWRVDLTTGAMTSTGPYLDAGDISSGSSRGTYVYVFAEDQAGDVYVGGDFESAGGAPTRGLAHFNTKTGTFRAVPGLDGAVNALAVLPNGDLIAGGSFGTAGGVPVTSIARYTPSTGVWSSMGADLAGSTQIRKSVAFMVNALLVLPGGDVLVGGAFDWVGGVRCDGFARYHPTTNTWTPIVGARNPQAEIDDLALMPDGRVVIVGYRVFPAMYDPVTGGFTDLSFPGSMDSRSFWASCLAMPNGDIYVTDPSQPISLFGFNAATGVWTAYDLRSGNLLLALPVSLELVDGASPRILAVGYGQASGAQESGLYLGSLDPATGTVGEWPTGSALVNENGSAFFASLTLRDGTVMLGTIGPQRLLEGSGSLAAKWMPGFVRLYNGAGTTRTVITSSPAPRNASPGETVEFSVAAVGYGQLRYEWLKDGTPIDATANPSAGTATLRLTNVSPVDAAAYSCRVLNICNVQATSDAVTLNICTGSVSIALQPAPAAACIGRSATFTVAVSSTLPVTYQWRKDGVNIDPAANPSAATAALTLTNLTPADADTYSCVISSPCGSITTATASLTLVGLCACNAADIAGAGETGTEPDGTLDGSDFIAFINSFGLGDAAVDPLADIAGAGDNGDQADGTIDGSDFIAFINAFALGC